MMTAVIIINPVTRLFIIGPLILFSLFCPRIPPLPPNESVLTNMTAIGEFATGFLHIVIGILCQLPYLLATSTFIFNSLPRVKNTNTALFHFLYALGLATSSITAIGTSFVVVAGLEAATLSKYWIAAMAFMLLRVVTQSLWSLAIMRVLAELKTAHGHMIALVPVNSERSVFLSGASFAFYIVEFALVAYLTPGRGNLIVWTPFYLYIPGLAVHLAFTAAIAYYVFKHPIAAGTSQVNLLSKK